MTFVRLLLTFGLPVFLSLAVLLLFVLMMQVRSKEWERWETEYAALQQQRAQDVAANQGAMDAQTKALREYVERQMVLVGERLDDNETDIQVIVDDAEEQLRDSLNTVVASICEADYGGVVLFYAALSLTEYLEGRDAGLGDARAYLDLGILIDDSYAFSSGVCQVDAEGSWQLLGQHPQVDPRRRE